MSKSVIALKSNTFRHPRCESGGSRASEEAVALDSRLRGAFAGMTQEEIYVILEPDPDDLARVKQWFHRLSERVRAVDFTGAHPLFAEDMIAFGTFENFITGRDRAEARNGATCGR